VEDLDMCGICGIINFNDQKPAKDQLKMMTDAMAHRGPDDMGFHISNNIGLAMRRLSIIDLNTGHQPISNEDNSIWVVLNGEIYNYVEIRQDLQKRGHIFRTKSDTEVIVHLYEEKGIKGLDDLNGMFAFALHDSKKNILWIVRDRLGIKPLYYAKLKNKLIFSSDLNSLNKLEDFDISTSSFLRYLGLAYVPTPHTIYNNIKKLPPAHYLWIEKGKVIQKKYWTSTKHQTWNGSQAEAKEKLVELITDSVHLRLRSDVPLGIFLSGGIDSSALVAFASKTGYAGINTFTINFEGKNGNDSSFASEVSSQYKTLHREINFGFESFTQELDELIHYLDEPVSDSAIVPSYLLSKIARDNGIKVLLTGAGADEIFGGYLRHHRPRFGSPRWIAENFPTPLRYIVSKSWNLFQPQRGVRAASSPIAFGLDSSGSDITFLKQIMKKDFINYITAYIEEQFKDLLTKERGKDYSYSRMELDLHNYLVDDVLSLTDKATMAASVEGRVPFLDHRIVEFAFSLPSNINLKDSYPKGLFVDTLKDDLSHDLLYRPKEGFNAPTSSWMLDSVGVKVNDELLGSPTPFLKEIIDIGILEKLLLDRNKKQNAGHTIFGLYIFNRWLRTHSA
jgi:asparagine synthase (glutamine-hydrolysing)